MVLTTTQTLDFFRGDMQMSISNAKVQQLANEGINTANNMIDFDKDTLLQIADNFRRPGGRIPDPTPGAANGATITTPPFVFRSKSKKRLLVACNLVRFYGIIGRPPTATNIQWTPNMRNFGEQWKDPMERRQDNDPETPKISKALPIIRWTEAFRDHLHRCIGVQNIPLVYVVREDIGVLAVCPPQATDQSYSEEHGSIEEDPIQQSSHTRGLDSDDSALVYYKLEEATHSTSYMDSIKPSQRRKYGRSAFMALTSHYDGAEKWEAEIKQQENLLHTRKW